MSVRYRLLFEQRATFLCSGPSHPVHCYSYLFMYTGHQGCTNIKLPDRSKRYQFRVQLSCAVSCHCVTIRRNVTCPYGGLSASIRDEWNKGIWKRSNDNGGNGLLCARGTDKQQDYHSRIFHFLDNGNSINLTDDINYSTNKLNTDWNLTDLISMSSCLNKPSLTNCQYNRCLFA